MACGSPEQRDHSALAQILQLSELFARLLADGQTSALPELLDAAHGYCHYLDQQLEPLVAEVEAKVHELADIFSLTLPDGLEYRDVLAEAHRQLTGVATQAAEDCCEAGFPTGGSRRGLGTGRVGFAHQRFGRRMCPADRDGRAPIAARIRRRTQRSAGRVKLRNGRCREARGLAQEYPVRRIYWTA